MAHGIYVSLFALGLFLGMLVLLEVGRRIGARRLAEDPSGAEAGVGTVVAASRAPGASAAASVLLLPALNTMIDITTTRTMAGQIHPPMIIFALLFGLALVSSQLVGYGMASSKARNWLHMLGLAFVMAVSVYVILDIEYPRLGFIRVDAFDQA
ncbi:MAG: hypothetical protein ACREQO_13400 [Candidatus Binatia bacterium]